jgi:hypothetical protein
LRFIGCARCRDKCRAGGEIAQQRRGFLSDLGSLRATHSRQQHSVISSISKLLKLNPATWNGLPRSTKVTRIFPIVLFRFKSYGDIALVALMIDSSKIEL